VKTVKYNNFLKLLASIIICELAGATGSVFTSSEIGVWYKNLKKPAFNPPNWVFGPVWTIVFILMGVSLYLVWSKKWEPRKRIGQDEALNSLSQKFLSGAWRRLNIVLIFGTQFVLNILWSVIFFGLHNPGVAFFELLMLWFAVVFTMVNFRRVSKATTWLLFPYILWISFAGILNYFVWILN